MPDLSGRSSSSCWEREWAFVQERAKAPRPPSLGCSTVSHDRLGFCVGCVEGNGTPSGWALEANGWRLLALRPDQPVCVGSSEHDRELCDCSMTPPARTTSFDTPTPLGS